MKTPYVVMELNSIAKQQQYQILSNELTRRLLNVHDKNEQYELTRIVDQMTQELKNSGYGIRACQEIVASGIRNLKTRISRKTKNGQEKYRPAKKSLGARTYKKLMSRENWFKDKKNCQETNQQSGTELSQPKRYNKHKLTDGLQQTSTTNDKKEMMLSETK